MSIDCTLMIDLNPKDPLEIKARLAILPRVGDKLFIDDITDPGRYETRDFGFKLEDQYIVTDVVHSVAIGRDDNGEVYAKSKPRYKPCVWVKQDIPSGD